VPDLVEVLGVSGIGVALSPSCGSTTSFFFENKLDEIVFTFETKDGVDKVGAISLLS
jgi:hypothetical protein